MTATLALLDGMLDKEEAMSNDATLPLSAHQVADVRAMMHHARDIGNQTLLGLEQAIEQSATVARRAEETRQLLNSMHQGVMAAMDRVPAAVAAVQSAAAAAAPPPPLRPPPVVTRAED